MSKCVESKTNVFKKREPITEEDMKRLLIPGGSGAFREIIRESGQDPESQVYVRTVVHCNVAGNILGARTVKCGTIHGLMLNGEEIWENCQFPSKIIVEDHDSSLYEDPNGMLTSNWMMNIPWKAKVKIEGKWKSVKKGAMKEVGLSELTFRMNFQPPMILMIMQQKSRNAIKEKTDAKIRCQCAKQRLCRTISMRSALASKFLHILRLETQQTWEDNKSRLQAKLIHLRRKHAPTLPGTIQGVKVGDEELGEIPPLLLPWSGEQRRKESSPSCQLEQHRFSN